MTGRAGLYDPAYEHDACGVAFVARLDGVADARDDRARAHRAREPRAPRRGRAPTRCTGDGAGILHAAAGRVLPRGASTRSCRRPAQYGVAVCFLPRDDEARRAELEQLLERHRRGRGPARRLLARRAGRPRRTSARRRRAVAPRDPAARRRRLADELAGDQDAFERKLYVIRRVAELAAGPDLVDPELLVADDRLQGDADRRRSSRAATPTCATRGIDERARARPLALLDEHVPELGARAPVPDDRPQRRDQHAARQRQLDARARVAARLRALRRRPRRRCCRSSARAARTRPNFDNVLELLVLAGRSLPHAMMMMIPEAYDGRDDMPDDAARLLRLPRLPDGAVGRAGGDRVHRRHA